MDQQFKKAVYRLVSDIPIGRVMTYGQVAAYCQRPYAARVVGQIAHFGPLDLPWHRVVYSTGKLAGGFVPNGRLGQRQLLESENIVVTEDRVDLSKYQWKPIKYI